MVPAEPAKKPEEFHTESTFREQCFLDSLWNFTLNYVCSNLLRSLGKKTLRFCISVDDADLYCAMNFCKKFRCNSREDTITYTLIGQKTLAV
jgi:hypothetical protein